MSATIAVLLLAAVAMAAGANLDVRHYGPPDALLHIAIVCGMHPREAFPRDLCARWGAAWAANPPARLRITLVADANPDGTQLWRANESMACWRGNGRGVDLNRNWPVPPACAQAPPPTEDAMGETPWPAGTPFSEWETRALASLIVDDPPDILLAMHSGMRALLTPYDACDASPANLPRAMQLARWLRVGVCDECVVGVSSRHLYLSRGTFTDWAHGVVGVPFVFTWEVWGPPPPAPLDCARAFSPPAGTMAYHAELRAWDSLVARLGDMDGDTWMTLLRWVGIVK